MYRCRKCRGLVATSDHVVEIEEGAGAAAFSWNKRDKLGRRGQPAPDGGDVEAGGLFVEPLRWMAEAVAEAYQGKLYCPK